MKNLSPPVQFVLVIVAAYVLYAVVGPYDNKSTKRIEQPTLSLAEMQAQAKAIPYRDLARNTEQYVGSFVLYDGKVIQVMEDGDDFTLRVNVTKDARLDIWDDTILLECNDCPIRPLEDDIVSFLAEIEGRTSYDTILGATITLPHLQAHSFALK